MLRFLFFLLLLFFALCLPAQELYFPPTTGNEWATMSLEEAGFCTDNEQALYDYLEATNTDAFMLLKDGKIVIERYFGDFTATSPHVWNSAGKSLLAMVVGIAADQDKLAIADLTSDYLGEGWTDCPEAEDSIRIFHQLTMTTGLSDRVDDVFCTDPECLECLRDPGARWAYHNGPYTLLGEVLEAATGEDLNDFMDDHLKRPTGITGLYRYIGFNRIFISKARSMARFGLLMQGGGVWDGNPILADTTYFQAMINSSQDINPAYGYLWWLNGKDFYKVPGLQLNIPGPISPNAPAD
ncbi:MAG: serine hydrolase domain-containing protein, partial [Bacteroidota bacterium]